jgi:hypothetical protein
MLAPVAVKFQLLRIGNTSERLALPRAFPLLNEGFPKQRPRVREPFGVFAIAGQSGYG